MTLRALSKKYHLAPARPPAEGSADTTIAFAFDSGYLEPFKVMVASMVHQGTLFDCPVAIYSDDAKLFEDEVVRAVCDKPSLVTGERKDLLYELARTSVKRQDKLADWNRGTFLKWLIFEPQPTSALLFLDVDMICLSPLEGLLTSAPGTPFLCAPQFQEPMKKLEPEALLHDLTRLYRGEFHGAHASRLNSGLMVVRDSYLSEAFFRELTDFTSRHVLIHEQAHLTAYFREHPSLLQMVSSRYNCQERWLQNLAPEAVVSILKQTAILHYAGPRKPWIKAKTKRSKGERAWIDERKYAQPLFPSEARATATPERRSVFRQLRLGARSIARRIGL